VLSDKVRLEKETLLFLKTGVKWKTDLIISYFCDMDKVGFIGINIKGSKENLDLSPDKYDIREIISILENVEQLLYPGDKIDRPAII